MLRSRLFLKLFLGFTSVSLLSAGSLLAITWQAESHDQRRANEQELRTVAVLLGGERERLVSGELSAERVAEIARASRLDVTVYDREGGVLATSTEDPGDEPTPSLRLALRDGEAWRQPNDLRKRYVYDRLVRDADGEPVAVVRVTRSAQELSVRFDQLWRLFAWYAAVTALVVVGVGYLVATHLVQPVRTLDRAAMSMAAGEYDQRAYVPNRDELGALADSFNRMSRELTHRLSELRQSDQRQATVLGGMIEGVVAIDERQRVLFANPAAGKLFGFLPPRVEGRPLLEVVRNHPLHQAAKTAIDTRSPQRLEIEWEERQLSVQVTPLVGEPATGAVVVLHDTTELNRLEALRRDFVANVSHELKTPLSSIKAYTETLLGGAVDDQVTRTRFLREIDGQSSRLEELIRDMLDLARIESAQQPFAIQTVGIGPAVEDCLKRHDNQAGAKHVRLYAEADVAPTQVKADPEGLRVILNNLVDNAVKYTPAGGEVRIAWRPDGRMVRIEVADTGIGIPAESVSRVFERFYRVDAARSRDVGGTGLGLSIVKHLAQSFGGAVAVESSPNEGATFTVTLPAA
ncbi:MAG: ATP-binding protein [Planctomycetota bacterium]